MRLEYLPVIIGVLVILVGAVIIYDAVSPASSRPFQERRRRQRAEIDTPGEWLVALGTICLGASLIGNEVWRWTTVMVITGIVLLAVGVVMNRAFLREVLLFRGPARRTSEFETPPVAQPGTEEPRLRIR
jgi:hypothetical protein